MDKKTLERVTPGHRVESREHSHKCAYCGQEYMCRCPNPSDDESDCGGCGIKDEDLGQRE